MTFKNTIWANRIISLQKNDGSWGYFHTLSNPTRNQPLTTEQALRRLEILGFTYEDEVIKKAIDHLIACLNGTIKINDRTEKSHDWHNFTNLMLACWILRFKNDDPSALTIAKKWANVIEATFKEGKYNPQAYFDAYLEAFKVKPKGNRLIDIATFYQVSIVTNLLSDNICEHFFDYILNNETGIYYIYNQKLLNPPINFQSKQTSRYLYAIELLSKYNNINCKQKLQYVIDWLSLNQLNDGKYDLGTNVKDHVHFPLSDSWRNSIDRINDCSYRINKLILDIKKLHECSAPQKLD